MAAERTVRVGITGVSGDVGLGAIKGLAEVDFDLFTLGLDRGRDCAGFHLVDRGVQVPAVADPRYPDALLEQVEQHRIELLLPCIDSEIQVLAPLRERFAESGCILVVSDPAFVERCSDKLETSRWLSGLGFFAPRTLRGDAAFERVLEDLGLPLVAKPRGGNASKGLHRVSGEEELARLLPTLDADYCLQQALEGPEYTCGLLFDREGVLRDAIAMRRSLRQGRTDYGVFEMPLELANFIEAFGERVEAFGAINLQLRLDEEGRAGVFEINPRLSGSTAMRVAVGFNDPLRMVRHLCLGQPIHKAPVRPARVYRMWTELVVPIDE